MAGDCEALRMMTVPRRTLLTAAALTGVAAYWCWAAPGRAAAADRG